MKKLRILSLFAAMAILLGSSGCVMVGWTARGFASGEGPLVPGEHEVGAYDKIDVAGYYRIVYSSAPSTKVRLDIQENLRQYITFEVRGGKLFVGSTREISILGGNNNTPVLYISNPDLKGLYVSGAVDMEYGDVISGDTFDLEVSGGCDIQLSLDVNSFKGDFSGASDVDLKGTAHDTTIDLSGAGDVNALDLQAKTARFEIAGAASASISCSERLDVDVSGAGSVRYRGNPYVNEDISGAGSVKRVSD